MSSDPKPYYKYYHYDPSLAAAVVLAIAFGLATVWHLFLIIKYRTWYFIPLLIGGIFEITGYAARGISHAQAPNLTLAPYVIQTLLILVAPALFAASIYMALGRIMVGVGAEGYSLVRRRWLTRTFVISDTVSFFVQLGGAGLMSSSKSSTASMGSHIILAGLIFQILLFSFFILTTYVFHRRLLLSPTPLSSSPNLPSEKFVKVLYVTSGLVMVRSIVRVAEFVEGFEGTIIRHEGFLYGFDGVLMWGVMVGWGVWYPWMFKIGSGVGRVKEGFVGDGQVELESSEMGRE